MPGRMSGRFLSSFTRLNRFTPMRRVLHFLALLASVVVPFTAVRAAETFELRDGDRVLFIGDTFIEREGDYGYIETRLTAAFPDRKVTFRNLGWAADSPMGRARASFDWNSPEADWLKRVKEQLALVKPTVAFLSYGATAGLELVEAATPAASSKTTQRRRQSRNSGATSETVFQSRGTPAPKTRAPGRKPTSSASTAARPAARAGSSENREAQSFNAATNARAPATLCVPARRPSSCEPPT